MTPEQGRGLQVLKRLTDDAIARMPRDDARSFIDALENAELADLMDAASAAGVATGTGGNLFYESAAARLRARFEAESFPQLMTTQQIAEAQGFRGPMRLPPRPRRDLPIEHPDHPFNAPEAVAERVALPEKRSAAAKKGAATRRARRGGQ